MNKQQKALDYLVRELKGCKREETNKTFQELVGKSTPKRPLLIGDAYSSALSCPNCKMHIVNVWNNGNYQPKYCHYCGQAIDWSSEGKGE